MKIRLKLFLFFMILVIPIGLIGYFSIVQINKLTKPLVTDIPQNANNIIQNAQMNYLSEQIRYYDELLTQSARNYAFTGDKKWQKRYQDNVPELDKIIKQTIQNGDSQDKKVFTDIDTANLALVVMEEKAMSLVDQDDKQAAVEILESAEYWNNKNFYKDGLDQFIKNRGLKYESALTVSNLTIDAITINSVSLAKNTVNAIIVIIIVSISIAIFLALISSYLITKPLIILKTIAKQISEGDLTKRADVDTKDETGDLAQSFNEMTDNLQKINESIEKTVKERTAELEKTNKFMIGRELEMVNLKQKLKELEERKLKL